MAELQAGFKYSTILNNNDRQLNACIQKNGVIILNATLETIDIYSVMTTDLKLKGIPILSNDI